MASASPLKDIDEQFLQCLICLDQLKEPKLLPCLHRYCRDCMKKIIKEQDSKITCPTCREVHDLPKDGIDGFKTDFNTKNIIEFIQLQDSVKQEPLRVCIHCTKKLKVTAYCFKCKDFLCEKCHEHHLTNMIVKDHRPHIFPLSEVEARSLTIEKLASLKEAPRCHKHPDKISELCCSTCGNLPICVPCTYGAHRGHDLQEVLSLAERERGKLSGKFDGLMEHKEKIYGMQERMRSSSERLIGTVKERERELREEFDLEEDKIKTEIHCSDIKLEERKNELDETLKRKMSTRKQELEKEIKIAQDRYDKACEEDRREIDMEFHKLQEGHDRENARLRKNLEAMNKGFQELLMSLQDQQQKQAQEVREMSDHFDDVVERFENVTKMASSILAAKHDWTDVQCIPNVCAAIDPLMAKVKEEYPQLAMLTSVTVKGLSSVVKDRSDITEKEESVVDIEGVKAGWSICGITGSNDGNIVITGANCQYHSLVTVVNMKGKQLRNDVINLKNPIWHHCDSLSQFKIATTVHSNELGVYDVRDGTYIKTDISHITGGSRSGWYIYCLAVNPANNHMIVGWAESRNMYVFDIQMKHICIMVLPKMFEGPEDITVHGENLLVCEYTGTRAYAVAMKGSECELMYEFPKPDVDGSNWSPHRVCTDKNGFIYMLWRGTISNQTRCILVQYSQDGSQILTTRLVDKNYDPVCITTVETDQGEKLLMVTGQKLIIYGLSS